MSSASRLYSKCICYGHRGNISGEFSRNSEAKSSENLEEVFTVCM